MAAGATVTGMTHDSRRVVAGSLSRACAAAHHDGHDHAAAAVSAGAVALLVDQARWPTLGSASSPSTRCAWRWARWPTAVHRRAEPGAHRRGRHRHQRQDHDDPHCWPRSASGRRGDHRHRHPVGHEDHARGARAAGPPGRGGGRTATPRSSWRSRRALALHRVDGTRFAAAAFTNLGTTTTSRPARHGGGVLPGQGPPVLARAVGDRGVQAPTAPGQLLLDAAPIEMVPYSLADAADLVVTADHHELTWRGLGCGCPLGEGLQRRRSRFPAASAAAIGIATDAIVTGLAAVEHGPGALRGG